MVKDDGYALVLSGGGAKGVYHMGVWQALLEIGIKIDAVVGSSVGAMMAGLIAQGDYKIADAIIRDIGIDKIVAIPEQLVKDGQIILNAKNFKYLEKLQKDIIEKKGLNTHPLRHILETYLDEKKIRKNKIDFGITTYEIKELKPRELFIDDIEEGLLIDYILASATFPGFSMTEIKKKKFIDGGVYNNIPFSLAKERGYKKIIVVDISGIGWNRRPDITGTETIYIKNSIQMGGVLNFDKTFLTDYRRLGYLDTLKVFNRIEGLAYFFKADEKIYKNLEGLLYDNNTIKDYSYFLEFGEEKAPDTNITLRMKGILPREMRHYKKLLYSFAECAAWSLAMKKLKLYDFDEFIRAIWEEYCKVEKSIADLEQRLSAKTVREWFNNILYLTKHTDINELFKTSLYEYDRRLEKLLQSEKTKFRFTSLGYFFPKLNAAKVFFVVLKRYFKS
ncbi:MAG: patatin-like phospholipase family protein [Spirochaetales bacterium]|nr:patatin-like phospholipase family protein [Spirochaetales bacterium]